MYRSACQKEHVHRKRTVEICRGSFSSLQQSSDWQMFLRELFEGERIRKKKSVARAPTGLGRICFSARPTT